MYVMSMQRQEQAQARKRFPWTRLIIAIAAFLLLAAVTLIWILSYGHVISRDLASILTIIFTVLAIAVPFYLWLFPISTDKPDPPVVAPSQPTPQPSPPGPIPEQPSHPETPPTATWNVPSRRNPLAAWVASARHRPPWSTPIATATTTNTSCGQVPILVKPSSLAS